MRASRASVLSAGIPLFACLVVGARQVAPDDAMRRALARDRVRFGQLTQALGPFTPLLGHSEVQAWQVETNFLGPDRADTPPRGEARLDLPGNPRLLTPSVVVSQELASRVRAILTSAESYRPEVYSTCIFSPTAAYSFPKRGDLTALVCFECKEVAFTKGAANLGMWVLRPESARELLRITGTLLPDLAKESTPDE